ncbi:MAG: sensor histidine kinase [Pseudomonadota bacterium]
MSVLNAEEKSNEAAAGGGGGRGLSKFLPNLGARPEFYLVYLFFYGAPWLFRAPSLFDVAVAAVAITIFIPIYLKTFARSTPDNIPVIALIALIGYAVTPFWGSPGVFHIYAAAQAGYQRPGQRALWLIAILTIVYVSVSYLMGRSLIEIGFVVFMGTIVGVGCIAEAAQLAEVKIAENARALEREEAAIAERARIARDLHDVLGQTLTMVALKADIAGRTLGSDPAQAERELREIRDAARRALSDVRAAVSDMTATSILGEIDRARRFLDSGGVTLTVTGAPPTLNPTADTVLGLVVREAVTNVIRHAGASAVTIRFEQSGGVLKLAIQDDGIGSSDNGWSPGSGLSGLTERVASLDGTATFSRSPGFRVSVDVPLTGIAVS